MGDKKNEDFVVQISDGGFAGNEKEAFMTKATPSGTRGQNEFSQSLSKLDNSPLLSVVAYCFSSIRFPISLLLVGMIYTSTKALQFLSVPVYTIFKNLTIIVIAYGEVLWFGGSVTPLALLSFGLMVLSSVVAAWADIQSAIAGDFGHADSSAAMSTLNAGYAWMGLNVFCTASYVLGMRKVIKKMNFKDWDTMYYNNLLTIPVLFICSLLAEDWSGTNFAKNFPDESRNRIIIGMVYSGLAAIFISYCSAWCIRVTSSTTYSMVGALNKLPIAISGLVFFAAPVTFGSVSAIVIGFVSGIVYAWARVRQSSGLKDSLPTSRPPMSASSQSSRDAANS
ncbi:GDP-mannose transporter [Metarhizium anisopliae]|nr:GDP-mannose transporter [Metarhizium anisopliae]